MANYPMMLPNYIYEQARLNIRKACQNEMRAMALPLCSKEDLLTLLLREQQIQDLKRANYLVSGHSQGQGYYAFTREDGIQTTWIFHGPANDEWLWPTIHEIDPDHHIYKALEGVQTYWSEVQRKWMLVHGYLALLNMSGQPVTVLKALWPDFDLLFRLSTSISHGHEVTKWLRGFVYNTGRPRDPDSLVAGAMDYLEDIRRTVLSASIMPVSQPFGHGEVNITSRIDVEMHDLPWKGQLPRGYPDEAELVANVDWS